jgi:hypothetical protein
MCSIIVAAVLLYFLPTIIRGSLFGLLVVAAYVVVAHAQQQRTSCYDSFPARICETFDGMGNIIAKSRCYRSGNDMRCDTQSFNGTPTTPFIPNGDRPQR